MKKKIISIWGSTGSIGKQALDVIGSFDDRFKIHTLTAHTNCKFLLEQAERFQPKRVVITGPVDRNLWEAPFKQRNVALLWGREGLLEAAGCGSEDLVVNSLVGSVGLEATIRALEGNTSIALANKEVLVMAGELISGEVKKRGLDLLPIDSEHSAIFQCLRGEDIREVQKIILTASGGPFLNMDEEALEHVTVAQALAHPNWSMGKKVTIDSATMMNKGLEVIEARWLFDIQPEKIQVVVHPQSIIHSMVVFVDGSIKAQLGIPDMRVPISHALTHPERWPGDYGTVDFENMASLTFLPPDTRRFPCLKLAYDALEAGGTAPAVLNGADEMAVHLFLTGKIRFSQIPLFIESALNRHIVVSHPGLEEILHANEWAKEVVQKHAAKAS